MKLEFSRQILEKLSSAEFYKKIRPIAAKFFHAGRQTDMTKIIIAFRNFANAPKNYKNVLL
jgi:hypothetical protein